MDEHEREVRYAQLLAHARGLGEAGCDEELLALVEELRESGIAPSTEGEVLEANYAWALLHVGRADDALEHVAELLVQADEAGATAEMRTINVYGMALVATGDAATALEVLTDEVVRAIAAENDLWVVSAHYLYRGDALAALDRLDEARLAWKAATQAHPDGIYGRRAGEALRGSSGAGPYRRRR